jgi:hypothetical protein
VGVKTGNVFVSLKKFDYRYDKCPHPIYHYSILGTILPGHAIHAKKDPTIRYSFCIDNEE